MTRGLSALPYTDLNIALKAFLDVDKLLTSVSVAVLTTLTYSDIPPLQLISIPTKQSLQNTEHAINDVILLKHFVGAANAVFEALTGARSFLLVSIREVCLMSSCWGKY